MIVRYALEKEVILPLFSTKVSIAIQTQDGVLSVQISVRMSLCYSELLKSGGNDSYDNIPFLYRILYLVQLLLVVP